MDLFRTLRISIYLLAGTGAFAISVAERSLFYLALIAVLGTISFLTIDRGKAKPLSAEVTALVTLVLFYLSMRHLRTEEHWQSQFPAAVAHFLCAWQGLVFFCVYSGPILVTFFLFTLVVVGMSGVVDSGPSLVARVACFVAVAVWTLYIHAVWRSRQEFSGQSTFLNALGDKTTPDRSAGEPFRKLPEGAFWGSLGLASGLSAACILLGVTLFFSAPRLEGILALFEPRRSSGENVPTAAPMEIGQNRDGGGWTSGIAETVSLVQRVKIELDGRVALRATFSKPARTFAGKKNRILLKRSNFSEYRNGEWVPDKSRDSYDGKNGLPIAVIDPTLVGPVFQGERATQSVETAALKTTSLLAAGPIVLAGVPRIEVDNEGGVRVAGAPLDRYTLTFSAPFDAANLKESAIAEHRNLQRYVRQTALAPDAAEAVSKLARQITQESAGDPAKARDIQHWLETRRRYTRNLENLRVDTDPLANFLLTTDPSQAVGHCGLFASAFVILCRANNMPARLCDGFAVQIDAKDPQSKTVTAANSDAHAWAEIYYQGIGWVPYDPTPATLDDSVQEASLPLKRPGTAPATPLTAVIPAAANADAEQASRGLVQDAWDTLLNFNGREQRKWYEKLSGAQTAGQGGILTGRGWGGWVGAVLAWIGIASALGWLVQLFARRGGPRKHISATGNARARAAVGFYNDLLQALSRRGYSRRPGQTPREFADAVLKRGGATYAPVRDVTEIFEAVRYGGGELGQDEFNRLQEALDKIREMTL